MVPLSEKAKGKQRVVQVEAFSVDQALDEPSYREFTVRFSDGIPDLVVQVTNNEHVRDVKKKIREARAQLSNCRLRLIHSGRLLADDTLLYSWFKSLEDKQKRALEYDETSGSLEKPPLSPSDGFSQSSMKSTPVWLHCSVGAELPSGEAEEEKATEAAPLKPLRGFDRLATAGFSEDDIAAFRRTFHSQSSGDFLDEETPWDGEDYDEHARVLEEQWIDSLDNGNAVAIEQSSTSSSVLQGLITGFFFPLIPFFFLREQHPAVFWENGCEQERPNTVVFSQKMQIAILLGFIINVTFGLWRYLVAP